MFSFFWLIILWIKEAFIGFFRNLGWNIAALFLSVFCLLGFCVSFIAGENADHLAKILGDKVEIQVDILETVEVLEHQSIMKKIETLSEVKEVTYISKEDMYEKVRVEMGEDADILEVLDANPFTARMIVKMDKPEQVELVAKEIESWNITSNIQFGEGYVERLLSITVAISKVGYLVTIIVGLATIYIVSSVIKFNIDQRKAEIKVKQLTGTGMFTIRFPFILEAMMITGLSSIIVYATFYFGYEKLMDNIRETVPYMPILEANIIIDSVSSWLFILAIAIGVIGSLLSTTRNLEKI